MPVDKTAQNERMKKYYQENKEKVLETIRKKRAHQKELLHEKLRGIIEKVKENLSPEDYDFLSTYIKTPYVV